MFRSTLSKKGVYPEDGIRLVLVPRSVLPSSARLGCRRSRGVSCSNLAVVGRGDVGLDAWRETGEDSF